MNNVIPNTSAMDEKTARMVKGWLDCCYDGDVEATARFIARQMPAVGLGMKGARAVVIAARDFQFSRVQA